MEINTLLILLAIVLIVSSAFLMAAETGMMSASRFKLQHMADSGRKRASLVLRIIQHPENLLGSILVGNNLVQAALSALITAIFISIAGEEGVIYATFVIAATTLFFCELVPKSYSSRHPESMSLFLVWPVYIWMIIFTPIVKVVTFFSNIIIRLFGGGDGRKGPLISHDELKTIIRMGEEEGVVPKEKRRILHRVLEMSDLCVRDVMVPRTRVKGIEIGTGLNEAVAIFKEAGFSRMPVYREKPDNVVGVVHVKDVLNYWGTEKVFKLGDILRQALFVPDSAKAERLLDQFRKNRTHIALVVDEYGGIEGLVTLEDILEEIVGEIQDEHDEEAERITELSDGSALVDGSATIKEVNERLNLDLTEEEDTTIGGFVMTLLGKVPAEKDTADHEDIRFIVERVVGRTATRIRIKRLGVQVSSDTTEKVS